MVKQRRLQRHSNLLVLLRQVRKQAGLTQVELAKKLGKPQSFVSKYEVGERAIDLLELQNICSIVGLSLTDFVKKFERFKNVGK